MKKVYVILIFACVLANAMEQYENQYNNRIQNPQNKLQPFQNEKNPNIYNKYYQEPRQPDYFAEPYNPIQNIGGIKDKIRTEEHETDYFKELRGIQRQNRYEEEKNEGNGKMMALSFVIGLLVGASAGLAWHFATKEVVKTEGEEAKGDDDEEKQCQHAIKENDAVINVQDVKNQNAAEYANQPETTY